MRHSSRVADSRRAAFTLLELVTVISVTAVVVGIAMTLIVSLQRVSTRSVRSADGSRSRVDFARQFRRDVHNSTSAVVSNTGNAETSELSLTSPTSSIRYSLKQGQVTRSVGDAVQHSKLTGYSLEWNATDALVRLRATPHSETGLPPWTVDAALAAPHSSDTGS